eukprot:NODE_3990_length_709_cov_68.878788_g3372_i0.p1 GENE.NODE_3990_length_709_cov_68.878788_g3372_i0~~NODE_3990_length_709_cov_68.878788_g3372_i0.p1  ORF type:complete len:85 (+),score=3.50 NODE_3990_length_709_cov_68.878788_g3372_i0:282-536(+)
MSLGHSSKLSPSQEMRSSYGMNSGMSKTKSVAYLPSLKDRMQGTKVRREFELSRIMRQSLMDSSMKAQTEAKYELLKLREEEHK